MQKLLNLNIVKALFIVIILALVGMYIPQKISVTLTPSLDKRVFYLSSIDKSTEKYIGKGTYVMFEFQSELFNNGKSIKAIKKVGCSAGDKLDIKYINHYYCNGVFLGVAKEKSKKGEPVENFKFVGIIPDKKIFVIGDHPDSYDSRYFGFLETKDVKAIAYPIF